MATILPKIWTWLTTWRWKHTLFSYVVVENNNNNKYINTPISHTELLNFKNMDYLIETFFEWYFGIEFHYNFNDYICV
jgi:hypothetical protein